MKMTRLFSLISIVKMFLGSRYRRALYFAPLFAVPSVASAQDYEIAEDVVVINGVETFDEAHADVMRALYAPSDWHFEVQQAPRFLWVDRQGRAAFGIGGKVKGTLQYDFDGACPDNGSFIPADIPVPADPAMKSSFDGTVYNSLLYFRLVGHNSAIGDYGMYIETQFSGSPSRDCFYVKQAWVNWNYLRLGKITALFNDDDAAPFNIDEQGPCGGSGGENVGVQWTPRFGKDDCFTAGIAVEVPLASYTLDGNVVIGNNHITHATFDCEIAQRVPDIPIYLQYAWDGRDSRVRLSAILRNLSYRDNLLQENKLRTAWGVGLSGNIASIPNTTIFYQAMYGRGIGQYINDLSGYGYDLIPDYHRAGDMIAPKTLGWFVGVQYDFAPKWFVSGVYSSANLYDQGTLGDDAYKQGQYVAANMVYEPYPNLQLGAEYLWGKRTNLDRQSNSAHRLMLMASYSF